MQHRSHLTKSRQTLPGGLQKEQNHSDNRMTMIGGLEVISGLAKAGAKAGTIGQKHLGVTPS